MDDDDEFLYGSSIANIPPSTSAAPQPIPLHTTQTQGSNGLVSHLESQAEDEIVGLGQRPAPGPLFPDDEEEQPRREENAVADDEEEEEEEEEEESDDDDVEIVLEAPSRSLDLRPNRPTSGRVHSGPIPTGPKGQYQQSTLTTEYTPIARGAPAPNAIHHAPAGQSTSAPIGSAQAASSGQTPSTSHQLQRLAIDIPQDQQQQRDNQPEDDGVDTSTLPPVKAPPSHPSIDPDEIGVYNGQSVLEVDLGALTDKPWRRPGSDISDWFNYGFDEISWEVYCYRRRDLGDLAHVLKTNIINFSGMAEEQLTVIPPEVRTMVMTGANVAMNNAAQGAMMGNPGMMMDMSGMVGPMGIGMNGDMSGMGGGMMPPGMMQDPSVGVQGQQGGMGMMQGNAPSDQQVGNAVGMMPDGSYPGANAGPGMMGIGMNEYGIQQDQNAMVQGMYPGMDVSQSVTPVASGAGRGASSYRGNTRNPGSGAASRGSRGSFPGRGRGRTYDVPPPAPVRPASPLPPGVPTGPRNANKYKDRDGNAPAVDGLDYGGGKDGGRRTPSYEPEERSSSRYSHDRKRRSSPGLDDIRSSKRR